MDRTFEKWLPLLHPPEKMLFLSGPRQVGKTTLACSVLDSSPDKGLYLNWDIQAHRQKILGREDLLAPIRRYGHRPLVILDELHKMKKFKAWLKGFYDENRDDIAIWVTGSGRLDLYQKGGDSLLGRYFLYRLHPLSLGEIEGVFKGNKSPDPDEIWDSFIQGDILDGNITPLFDFGGFPEPLIKQSQSFYKRWIRNRRERITHEDIRDLTQIDDLDRLEYLIQLLNPRIGSPLSINSLREDLEVAHETIKNWLSALKRVYYIFSLAPFYKRISRSIIKEQKSYYWDWSEVQDKASRFENMVISHLYKACHVWTDLGLGSFTLWYIRDKEKREVDALITRDGNPWLLGEIKIQKKDISPSLIRFAAVLDCHRLVQIVLAPGIHNQVKTDSGICHLVSASRFLRYLP